MEIEEQTKYDEMATKKRLLHPRQNCQFFNSPFFHTQNARRFAQQGSCSRDRGPVTAARPFRIAIVRHLSLYAAGIAGRFQLSPKSFSLQIIRPCREPFLSVAPGGDLHDARILSVYAVDLKKHPLRDLLFIPDVHAS